ncbi:MAG: aldehyde dehydrogenase family protein [Pseudomonadota bacterium]
MLTKPDQVIVESMVGRARDVLPELYAKTQEEVDEIVRLIAKAVYDNAEMLSELAVSETGMGNVPDKIIKCHMKSQLIYADLKDRKTVGMIDYNPKSGVVEIAEPVGVVGALIPTTNPAVTAMSNAMFALKGRNAIVLSPHKRAFRTIAKTVELMKGAARDAGLPEDAIQLVKTPSREGTRILMASVDVVLATGGQAMVKASYESGTPSFGVGPGNVPVVIHESADIDAATARIVTGRAYDNGLICASEQAAFVPRAKADAVLESFSNQGAHVVTEEEREKLEALMWLDDHLNPDIVGKSASDIARMAGFHVDGRTKVLLVRTSKISADHVFSREKLSPVLALYEYDVFEEAIQGAISILKNGGVGHTAAIHCEDKEIATRFAIHVPASRVIVNQSTATNAGGSRENGLVPTTTMGCGSWGNNATTDNVTVDQVINIKRLAFRHEEPRDTSLVFAA